MRLDDIYHGRRAVTEISLEFGSEVPYLSTEPRLTAQTHWRMLRTLDLTVQRLGAEVPPPFYLTTYNFPVLTALRLVNIPLDHESELSTLRSLTLKNAARIPELRTDFRDFMQLLCRAYRQLKRLTLDHALTDAPHPVEILSTADPLPLTALSVFDAPNQVSDVLDYLQLAACTELHLATTVPGDRLQKRAPNPFFHLLHSSWVCQTPPQLREMNKVWVEVTTGRCVRVQIAHDPMGPLVPAMQSTGALQVTFDIVFEGPRTAAAGDVMVLQAQALVAVAATIAALKMSAVSTIRGVTEQETELKGELRSGGRSRWYSRSPGRREWKEMALK